MYLVLRSDAIGQRISPMRLNTSFLRHVYLVRHCCIIALLFCTHVKYVNGVPLGIAVIATNEATVSFDVTDCQ